MSTESDRLHSALRVEREAAMFRDMLTPDRRVGNGRYVAYALVVLLALLIVVVYFS